MSWRLVVVVWALALAGAALCWRLHDRAGSSTAAATGPRSLLREADLPIERVSRIRLERGDEPSIVLERVGEGWMQVEPFPYPVDPFSARQLVSAALQLEVGRTVDGAALAEAGTLERLALAPPEAAVVFEWPDGSRRIDLGRLGVAGRAFVRLDGADRVDVVGQQLHQRVLGMDPKEWRLRRLMPETSVDATGIVVAAGETRTAIERSGRRWRMTAPVETRVDDTALEAFLRAIASAQSSGFLADQPESLAPFGLDAPVASLEVSMPDGSGGERTARLLVGAPIGVGGGDRYGMVEGRPTVVRLAAATLGSLFPAAPALVDPTGCDVRPADVKRLRVKGPDADFEVERNLDVWRVRDESERQVPTSAVNDLLQRLTAARAGRIAFQPFPRELAQGFVTLYGFDQRPLATVQVAHDPASDTWALENGDGVLRLFPGGFKPPLSLPELGVE